MILQFLFNFSLFLLVADPPSKKFWILPDLHSFFSFLCIRIRSVFCVAHKDEPGYWHIRGLAIVGTRILVTVGSVYIQQLLMLCVLSGRVSTLLSPEVSTWLGGQSPNDLPVLPTAVEEAPQMLSQHSVKLILKQLEPAQRPAAPETAGSSTASSCS